MIEKMKFVNITGPLRGIDRVITEHIMCYDIHLENTCKELGKPGELTPLAYSNPFDNLVKDAEDYIVRSGLDIKNAKINEDIKTEKAMEILDKVSKSYIQNQEKLNKIEQETEQIKNCIEGLSHFIDIDFKLESIKQFNYIVCRFGKFPVSSYKQFEKFLFDENEILFEKGEVNSEFVYCVYFTPKKLIDKVDSIFASLHFEELELITKINDRELIGTAKSVYNQLEIEIENFENQIKNMQKETATQLDIKTEDVIIAYKKIKQLRHNYDVRKYCGVTSRGFYIFVGWMTEEDAFKLNKDIEKDPDVVAIIEDDNESIKSTPPSKFKNVKLFQNFEMFVKMYGFPTYGEIDPTPFVAITYTLLFGIMFGDLGQGGIIALLGLFLYKKKGMTLGGVMTIIGISSMFFGIMYGSIFGYEEIIHPVLLRPFENINQSLLFAVGLGVGLIILSMLINIFNGIRNKKYREIVFSQSGVAGMIFYCASLIMIVGILTNKYAFSMAMITLFILVPLVLVAFREPIVRFLEKKKKHVDEGILMQMIEIFIETFEVLLTYLTNTLSFIRVGAFAISHGMIMSVVLLLSQTTGHTNFAIIVGGNLLVLCLEGLVVGIQVLRLEFYEMFSRFFGGGGREFISYKNNIE